MARWNSIRLLCTGRICARRFHAIESSCIGISNGHNKVRCEVVCGARVDVRPHALSSLRMRVSISRAEKPIGVPYSRPAADPNSHSYVDLKQDPEGITQIPEIRDWPELEDALRALNAPEAPYRTIGCEKSAIKQADGAHGVSGYVEIALANLEIARRWDVNIQLIQAVQAEAVLRWSEENLFAEFVIHPALWIEVQQQTWCFEMWVIVAGLGTPENAKERWSEILREFRRCLLAPEVVNFLAQRGGVRHD